jgi:hypothetical protein
VRGTTLIELKKNHRRNNVQLPDEYDQITRDLAPYRAFERLNLWPSKLEEASMLNDAYTFVVKDGGWNLRPQWDESKPHGQIRSKAQSAILDVIAPFLPDMNITHSIHDTPRNFVSYDHRIGMLNCAEDPSCKLTLGVSLFECNVTFVLF